MVQVSEITIPEDFSAIIFSFGVIVFVVVFKCVLADIHIHMSYFGTIDTPVFDFW